MGLDVRLSENESCVFVIPFSEEICTSSIITEFCEFDAGHLRGANYKRVGRLVRQRPAKPQANISKET